MTMHVPMMQALTRARELNFKVAPLLKGQSFLHFNRNPASELKGEYQFQLHIENPSESNLTIITNFIRRYGFEYMSYTRHKRLGFCVSFKTRR